MSCNSPLYRLPTIIEAVPAQFQHRVRHGGIIMNRQDRDLLIVKYGKKEDWFQQIACGQCTACRLEYSRQWAIRCVLESSYYKYNWFVTLTYNDECLPKGRVLNMETGEIERNEKGEDLAVLEPQDVTDFFKRLRMSAERKGLRHDDKDDNRYFYCGEYGEQFKRPHYHVLFFGLDIPDLEIAYAKRGNVFFYSNWLEKLWGKGIVVISQLNFDSAAYTARYVMKKQKGKGLKEFKSKVKKIILPESMGGEIKIDEFQEEFCRMSRRPGIGKKYFDEHKDDIYETDSLYVKASKGLMKVKPCRYYDTLFDVIDPDKLQKIKQQRKRVGKAQKQLKMANTTLNEVEYGEMLERKKQEQVKKLKREVE